MKKMKSLSDLALVYSSEEGRTCPECQKNINQCICSNENEILGSGNVKVQLETKGRKGKGVTVISDLALNLNELKDLAKELKTKCGTGGALKENQIEIQGDKVKQILELLETKGIKAKKVGGK